MNRLNHVAVIADGNGRWAERRGLERSLGHEQGLNKVEDMMHWCVDMGIPALSVYCFSWENWNRPKEEVDALFSMANRYFERYREFVENNIRVLISGTDKRVPPESIEKMERIQRETAHCDGLTLNLCCNYSGRMEIVDAVAKGARTEEEITAALYQNLPEPDLIIRTGGFQRLWRGMRVSTRTLGVFEIITRRVARAFSLRVSMRSSAVSVVAAPASRSLAAHLRSV